MGAGIYTPGGQGLPQASPAPLVHIEDAAGTITFTQSHQVVTLPTGTPGTLNSYRSQP